jgi:AraC-like DNA-binding protein
MPSADVKAVGELIQSIVNQSDTPSHEMRSWLGDQLINAVGFLLAARHKTPSRRSAEAIVSRAKAYISQHLGVEDLDAEKIAAAVNVSVKHLQRLFRSEGESPMRHLWQVRLAHAERLLRAGGPEAASVQEIAWQCGFSTAAHFSRVFKQRYGVSPGSIKGIPGGVQEIYLL